MVKASTLLVAAAFVAAPVLAAPAPQAPRSNDAVVRRSLDDSDLLELEAREPHPFNFGKIFRGVTRIAKKVAPIALKAAGTILLRRDEEGNLYVREVDADELALLQARDPKFNLGRTFRRVSGAVGQGLRIANRVASTAQSLGLRELEDGEYLVEREFDPSYLDLDERDLDFDELDERDPFNFGSFFNKAKNTATQVLRVADKVSSTAHRFGLRELDADELMEAEARSIDELD